MIAGKRLVVVMPAYNAARTLRRTLDEVPAGIVDDIVLGDDASRDDTVHLARELGIRHIIVQPSNRGYGANQKSCFGAALDLGADVVVTLHPDYQYTPRLIPEMAALVAEGRCSLVLGSRMLGGGALAGGMPIYKFVANRALTVLQNLCTGARLSEYHTGYRAYAAGLLRALPLETYADGFLFDNQIIADTLLRGCPVGEVACPARYFPEASSIGAMASLRYGMGVLRVCARHVARRALPHRRA